MRQIFFEYISLVSICLLMPGLSYSQSKNSYADIIAGKLTAKARVRLFSQSPTETSEYWLFLSDDSRAEYSISLSPRAIKRRAKVDPAGLLVDRHDFPISKQVLDSIRATGAEIHYASRWLGAVAIRADENQLTTLAGWPVVKSIDITHAFARPVEPDDIQESKVSFSPKALDLAYGASAFQNQFINVTKLHNLGYQGNAITIAILDSGFKTDHSLMDSTSVIGTWDFINDRADVSGADCPGEVSTRHQDRHGTLIWGVLAGDAPDTLLGVAPGADYLLAKTERTCGGVEIKTEEYDWIAAAEWADSIGADIISSSLGYNIFTDSGSYTQADLDGNTAAITIAADLAASKNILVVVSAGNERGNSWNLIATPADGDSVLAVGAVGADSVLAGFSSPGPTADGRIKPDIVTLGIDVWGASHQGVLLRTSGTSLAAPLVAGGAALALEFDSTLTAAELLSRIKAAGDRAASPDNDYGFGLFNALKASTIIRLDPVEPVRLNVGETIFLALTTSGIASNTPAISLVAPPVWMEIFDNGDGTAELRLEGRPDNPARLNQLVELDVGYYSDTLTIEISTVGYLNRPVVAGPNPFKDSVTFFVRPAEGGWKKASIFNSAGEFVWGKVNISSATADTPIVWTGQNSQGQPVSAGVYLAVIQTGTRSYRIKLLRAD